MEANIRYPQQMAHFQYIMCNINSSCGWLCEWLTSGNKFHNFFYLKKKEKQQSTAKNINCASKLICHRFQCTTTDGFLLWFRCLYFEMAYKDRQGQKMLQR